MRILAHASAIRLGSDEEDRPLAAIFLGPSGAGKSTAATTFGKLGIIADDRVVLDVGAKEARIATGDGLYRYAFLPDEEWVSLGAVFYLHQSSELRVERLSREVLAGHLSRAIFELWWNRRLSVAERFGVVWGVWGLAGIVPGFDLFFEESSSWDSWLEVGLFPGRGGLLPECGVV